MPDLELDLRNFRCALLVSELGSFRRAADVLNLAQSTVSRRVQILERCLGVLLFERSRTGARLTYAGEKFIRDAAFGAGHLQRAASDLAPARQGVHGKVRVGIIASFSKGFLAEVFAGFRHRLPYVELHLEEGSSQANAAGVLSGRLDVAFISGAPRLPRCHARQLWKERIFLALPTNHVLNGREKILWQEIKDETFIISADGFGPEAEDYLIKQLAEFGFRPSIVIQKVGRDNLLNLVSQGFGLTLTTYSTLGNKYSGVEFIPIGNEEEFIVSSVVWPINNQNPVLKKLIELCEMLSR